MNRWDGTCIVTVGKKCVQETQRLGVHGLFRKFSKTIKIDIKFHKIKKMSKTFGMKIIMSNTTLRVVRGFKNVKLGLSSIFTSLVLITRLPLSSQSVSDRFKFIIVLHVNDSFLLGTIFRFGKLSTNILPFLTRLPSKSNKGSVQTALYNDVETK